MILFNYKKAQVTIFIIIGIIIVALIALFLLLRTEVIPNIGGGSDENSNSFLKSCLEDKVKETLKTISMQGGSISNPLHKTFKFDNEEEWDISYLCYNRNYYARCINQEPVLIGHLKEEIKIDISSEVSSCFDALVENLINNNYEVQKKYNGFEVEFMPKQVKIKINGELTLTKNDETKKEKNFGVNMKTRFYDLAIVVQEIVSQEARFCYFNNLGYMSFNPEFNIEKFETSDLSTIYTVQHRDTQEKFRFAIRGCVNPPGV